MESRGRHGPHGPRDFRGRNDRRSGPGGRGGRPGPHERGGRPGRPGQPRRGGPPERSSEERLSRLLAFVLRHHPDQVGIALDERGAVDLDVLTAAIRAQPGFDTVDRQRIERLAGTGAATQRFEITGNLIRAHYGHSLAQSIRYEEAEPPEMLFHGTTPEAAQQALTDGLKTLERQRVHLSIDAPAAREVGRRRCPEPVILRVDTLCARKGGVKFYRGGPAVWLSDELPPECITRVE